MKLLKKLLKFVFALLGVLIMTLLVIIGIDAYRTNYLDSDRVENGNINSYLITHVNVVPMTKDTILTDKMVYIKAGVIEDIADDIDIDGVKVIDAENKFLMPGLIDMHVHVWDRYELGLYLSNGVTAVRNVWGMPMHLRMKEDINNDEIISPIFFTSGPKLTGPEFIGDDNLNLTDPEEARNKVVSYKDKGYNFIKTYYGLTPELFDAVLEQAKLSDMDIIAHPSQKVPYSYHLDPQIKSVEHTEDFVQQPLDYTLDTVKLKEVIDLYAGAKHSTHCPTLVVFNNIYQMLVDDNILQSESLQYMNPLIKKVDSKGQFERWHNAKLEDASVTERIKKQHDFHLYIIKELHEANVRIICGTDAGIGVTIPGFSIHKELGFYKEAGLSNYEVLKTATVNAAKTHAIMNDMGVIEKGKVANLILSDNNPLTDLSTLQRPSAVFVKGRKLDRKTLDSFEEKAKDRKNLLASGIRYAENLIVEK
ncbi:MAG: amidohydrolase [Muricauda sp.]|nr:MULTISPECIES: amidohydrolase family protein [unclassified Allomuricauda]MAU16159.1 amidohydrolase [Allomuricauda sp.]|tara:strand:+ start:738 stop:2171 length:1434 start_codon:yes stop_codon:yes gene_type:complete